MEQIYIYICTLVLHEFTQNSRPPSCFQCFFLARDEWLWSVSWSPREWITPTYNACQTDRMTSHNQNQIFVYQSLGIGYGWMLNQYILPQSKCKCVLFRQNSLNSPVQGNGNHLRGRGARWTWVLIIHIHIVPDIAKNWTANHHFEELHAMFECWEMLRAPMGMSQLKKTKTSQNR